MFDSLHIRGFRAFEDLQLTGLGRVNLLVGENNIGKTTVLEALKIRCAGREAPWELIRILEERQEVGRDRLTEGEPQPEWDIRRVFHSGSNGTTERPQPKISIGPVDEPSSTLSLELSWAGPVAVKDDSGESIGTVLKEISVPGDNPDESELLVLSIGSGRRRLHRLRSVFGSRPVRPRLVDPDIIVINCQYVPAGNLGQYEVGELWDQVVLTDLESDDIGSLKIIALDVERVSLIEASVRREAPIVNQPPNRDLRCTPA